VGLIRRCIRRVCRSAGVVMLMAACPVSAQTLALTPQDYASEPQLAQRLWSHSREVIDARQAVGQAAAEVTRARKYPNPTLDFSWGTIPVGPSNPPDLHDPIGNIPNYNVGISELVELFKRTPRLAATRAELDTARAVSLSVLGSQFFALLDAIGRIAEQQARAAVLGAQVRAGERLLELDQARASKGDIAAMDVDRTAVEHARLVAAREAAETAVESARRECAEIIAASCPRFESGVAARRFLRTVAGVDLPSSLPGAFDQQRPDIAALDAALNAAHERVTLAERHVIPDVTVRFGYTYDTFVVAGNQRQSVGLGVQVPLPVLDQGQADLEAATALLARARAARASLVESARLTFDSATRERQLVVRRIQHMRGALAKARTLRDAVEGAARAGGVSQVDVLLARRTYQELLLERTDLDAAAYAAVLKIRQAAALFPRPETDVTAPPVDGSPS
jgi:outer membrane protein, heavy metal efflux system